MSAQHRSRHALVLRDIVAATVTLSILAALLAVSRPRHRSLGQLGESMSNLREFGVAFDAYGKDNAELVATFSWKAGITPSTFPDLKAASSDVEAGAFQAVDIMRRRANLSMTQLPRITSWVPHILYSHLVLIDYLGNSAPWNTAVSPGDANQLKWASDPLKWQQNGAPAPRWSFASSYELPTPYSSSPDSGSNAISQSSSWNAYVIPSGATFGGRKLSEVAYPANKALMYERFQWFFGPRVAFCLYEEARVPMLAADGNVQLRQTKLTNRGWQPNSPTSPSPTTLSYDPQPTDPPALSGLSNVVIGHMRWTRRAIAGRDFDAAEVP